MGEINNEKDLERYEGIVLREISRGAILGFKAGNKKATFYTNKGTDTITCKLMVGGETIYYSGKEAMTFLMQSENLRSVVADYELGREKETYMYADEQQTEQIDETMPGYKEAIQKRLDDLKSKDIQYFGAPVDNDVDEEFCKKNSLDMGSRVAKKVNEGMSFEEAWGTTVMEIKFEIAEQKIKKEDLGSKLSDLVYNREEVPDKAQGLTDGKKPQARDKAPEEI